nr:MAG: ORF1 [Torque teno midi virus]
MPFWWRRRRKPWWGNWRRRFRIQKYKRRNRRRRFTRRRNRKFARRRRRRRHYKVRKKRQKIILKQWQPDSIVKCKIKGLGCLVAGAQGRQFFCYTNEKPEYLQPKAPGGGGFGVEVFTLEYLYKEWLAHKNIWTKSNDYKDLVRYTGTTMTFFRHPTTDFIIRFSRQPPFELTKDSYMNTHPVNMLLSRHHRIILSQQSKPNGKIRVKVRIKPPKQMTTKWFFQQNFATAQLFQIEACAANLNWSIYGPNTQSSLLTFYSLNTNFYQKTDWAQFSEHIYTPYLGYPTTNWPEFEYPVRTGTQRFTPRPTTYYSSIEYDTGFFNTKVLTATKVYNVTGQHLHEVPVTIARYNPNEDTGVGNAVWLISTISDNHYQKPSDKDLIIVGKPIWMALWGFWNYIQKIKKTKEFLLQGMFVIESPAIKLVNNTQQKVFPIIDYSFLLGKMPYEELLTSSSKLKWYPNVMKQQETINNFIQTGPYIPKYAYLPQSTWNLTYKYSSYFKWGGPEITDQPVANPADQGKYDVPDTVTQTVQISDPLKQNYKAMLRAWDVRRGMVTSTALKRIQQNLEIDSIVSIDETEPKAKKIKITAELPNPEEETQEIKDCLLSLCEEDTFQKTEDIQQLIDQQQQQQLKLRKNLLKLLLDLKERQRQLQLQTGIL